MQQLLDREEELYATTDFESIDSKSAQNLANKIQDVRNNITILAKDNRNKGIQPPQTNDTLTINSLYFLFFIHHSSSIKSCCNLHIFIHWHIK